MSAHRRELKAPDRPRIRVISCHNPTCSETFTPKNKDHLYHTKTCKNAFHKLCRQEGERRLLLDHTMADNYARSQMNIKETVKAAVLRVLIKNHPIAKNYVIERAHPDHGMSGTRALRFLSAERVVDYTSHKKRGIYEVHTTKAALKKAYIEELKKGK